MATKFSIEDVKFFYKDLPGWGKAVSVILAIGIPTFTIYSILDAEKKRKERKKALEDLVKKIDDLNQLAAISPATYQQSQYKLWADSLQQAFSGCDTTLSAKKALVYNNRNNYSDSGRKLFDIITKLKNDTDFLQLDTAWGIRNYDGCFSFQPNKDMTFAKAVSDELDQWEIAGLNKLLKSQYIQYNF